MQKEKNNMDNQNTRPAAESVGKNIKKIRRAERSVRNYQWAVLRIMVLVIVLWVLFFRIVGLTHMPNADMYPRVDSGDLVMFYRLDKDVKAQDVIVIEKTTPNSSRKSLYMLRVVAAEGDTVEIDQNRLYINGNAAVENGIFSQTTAYEGYTEYPLTLGPGECFVLADSRDGGTDSRYFGTVRKEEIQGTVITLIRRNNL